MKEKIIQALADLNIDKYLITETVTESLECFYVKKRLDLKRRTDVTDIAVTVYHLFEKEGQKMLGSSEVQIYQGMGKEEVKEALKAAYHAAALVCNPYYELFAGTKEEMIPATGSFAGHSLEENMKVMTGALYAADNQQTVFINSAEIFAKKQTRHIVNSEGVDVGYEVYEVSGEYVVQCVEPQDVETYHSFSYRDADTEALQRDVEESLSMTRARANAYQAPPKTGEYALILSGEYMRTLFNYYLERSAASLVYQKYSNYAIGQNVQGEDVRGDALTVYLKAKEPYSREGIPMKDRILMENGELKTLHSGCRFSYYLGMEPTGDYRCISIPVGNTPLEELKTGPYLHVVRFSDFQMDSFSGHFSGEIRLAYWCDGENVIPVTGGAVNGSILKVQNKMTFSAERYRSSTYEGPLAVRIEGLTQEG